MKDLNENRPGYKETKIGWIPEDWETASLGDISTVFVSNVDKKSNSEEIDVLLCNYTDVYYNDYIKPGIDFMKATASENEIKKYKLQSGDVIITKDSETNLDIAVSAIVKAEFPNLICGYHLAIIRPQKNKIYGEYLNKLFRLSIIRNSFSKLANGVTRFALSLSAIKNAIIPVPNFSEQIKIAEILSIWDEAIEQARKLIEVKKRRKKALMQQLITGIRRLKPFAKPTKKNSYRFFDLPADWSCLKIKEIAQECSGRNTGKNDLPVFACSKHLGFVESSEYFAKRVFSEDTSNYKVIRRGQFGFPSNHIEEGSIGLLQKQDIGLVSPIYIVFKCNENIIPEYLYAVFKTDTFRHIFKVSTNASVDRRGSLRWKEFSLIHVPMPSTREQKDIANVLETCDDEIVQIEAKLKALEKQKRGLMQKLLTGEVRVKL
jgi:type I restriction enzyme S subunit